MSIRVVAAALAGALGLSIQTGGVDAADRDPPRLVPFRATTLVPLYSWNGLYAGLVAGYGFGTSTWTAPATGLSSGAFDLRGAQAGGTLGYNIQFNAFVVGIEADASWNSLRGSSANIVCITRCETRSDGSATARGRVGTAFDRFLPYLTGGVVAGEVRLGQPGAGTGASTIKTGWTAGAGVEYAFAGNWSAKIEYLYVDLGRATCGAGCTIGAAFDVALRTSVARGGVNYRF